MIPRTYSGYPLSPEPSTPARLDPAIAIAIAMTPIVSMATDSGGRPADGSNGALPPLDSDDALSCATAPPTLLYRLAESYTGFSPRMVTRRNSRRSLEEKSVRACSVHRLSHIKMSPGRQACS
jgi:hypothetical protein